MRPVVLIVDDDDDRLHSDMDELFANEGDYLVIHAYSWTEGYARALKHSASLRLVLIDQVLDEDRWGTDLVRLIRNRHPVTPIVLVTRDDNDTVMESARQAGATAFFPKRVVYGPRSPIARTFVYWAQGGAFPADHLDRLTTFIRAFAHRSRGCFQRFKTANGAGAGTYGHLASINTTEIDCLDTEFERIVDVYRLLEKHEFAETSFEIGSVVKEEIEALRATNRHFSLRIENVGVFIRADRELIKLAVREILDNAVKYSGKLQKGERSLRPINVTVMRQEKTEIEFAIVRVRDFGQGVEDEDIGIIHNLYVRGRNAVHTNTYGSGLGLDLVSKVLEKVRVEGATGYCDVRSPRDGETGTVAELFIPISASET